MARRSPAPASFDPVEPALDPVAAIRARPPVPVPFKADGDPDMRAFLDACNAVPEVVAALSWAADSRDRRSRVSAAVASLNARSYRR